MKNFTNNFKQFTSRLSARWLIMALMLLLGTGSAWAASLNTNEGDNRASGVEIQYNSTSEWYRIGSVSNMWDNGCTPKMSGSQNNPLDSHNFGTVTTLKLKGGEVNTRLNDCNSGCNDYAEARYSYKIYKINASEPSNYTTGFTANTWECGSRWDNASDVSIYNSANIDLLSGLGAGDYNLKMKMDIQARWSGGTYGDTWSHTASATFTVPGYSTTTGEKSFGEVDVNSSSDYTIELTHYGSVNSATVSSITGTNKSEFTATIEENGNNQQTLTVTFKPTTVASDKTATVTVTDAYDKTYTLTVTGTGKQSCNDIPEDTYSLGNDNVWNGEENPVTINYDANNFAAPTSILYDGESDVPSAVGTYQITIDVPEHGDYCESTIDLGEYAITCPAVEKPSLIANPATICEGTEITLSNYENTNTNQVKWYSDSDCNSIITTATIQSETNTFYAKAYHEDSDCYSDAISYEITGNPKPYISITGSNSAAVYEDVTLTATATGAESIAWSTTLGTITPSADGNSAVVTHTEAGVATVTATATSAAGCKASTTHTVTFSAEDCTPEVSNDIQITFTHPAKNNNNAACQYWGFGDLYYSTNNGDSYTKVSPSLGTSTSGSITRTISNLTVDKIKVYFQAYYEYTNCRAKTTVVELDRGNSYSITISSDQQGNGNGEKEPSVTKTGSLTQAPPISAPAAKTISVSTTDGEGNIIFSGQVVKTGCDATNEYGFQYSSDQQTWTTVKVGENAAAGTAISNNTVNGLDGPYYVRAYITNDNSTQYGAIEAITVSTKKYPITTVTLTHVKNQAGDSYSAQELANLIYCVGDIVWFKLEQNGSNFQYYEWISYPGTELTGMYDGGMFKFKITESGNVGIRLRNDANVDGEGNPTWVESDPLGFNTHPEPTAPTISFATATICSNDAVGATLTLGATVSGQAYELWKYANDDDTEGSKVANFDPLNCTENNQALQFTGIKTAGKYFVKTYYTAFCTTVIANSTHATLTVVNANDVSISITPATATTTPWMPVKLTISATDDYTLEVPDGVEFSQKGDICSVKIPLPDGATGGEGQYENVSFPQDSYTVTANLVSTGGEDNPCAVPATATVTLTPYVEECTIGH